MRGVSKLRMLLRAERVDQDLFTMLRTGRSCTQSSALLSQTLSDTLRYSVRRSVGCLDVVARQPSVSQSVLSVISVRHSLSDVVQPGKLLFQTGPRSKLFVAESHAFRTLLAIVRLLDQDLSATRPSSHRTANRTPKEHRLIDKRAAVGLFN